MTNQGKDAIVAILFRVEARPGKRQELIKFLQWDREQSMKGERGTIRFDFFEDPDADHVFYVYEAYEDAAAFDQHKAHEPYQRWSSVEFRNEVIFPHKELRPVAP